MGVMCLLSQRLPAVKQMQFPDEPCENSDFFGIAAALFAFWLRFYGWIGWLIPV